MRILFWDGFALGISTSPCAPLQVFREHFAIRVMSPLCIATMQQFMGRLQILIKIFAALIKESAPYSVIVQLPSPRLFNLIIVMYIISMRWPLFTSFAYYIG